MQYSHFGCALRKIHLPNGKLVWIAVQFTGDNYAELHALEQGIRYAEGCTKASSASSVLTGLATEAKAIADYYDALAKALTEAKPSDVECYDVQ